MNLPSPALVTQSGARRLPRVALLLLCAAYVLPGLFGRDPWHNADLLAFAQMAGLAEGRTSWLTPTLGALPVQDLANGIYVVRLSTGQLTQTTRLVVQH